MQATMETTNLRKALQQVGLVRQKSSLPVLGMVHMECTNGKALLTATDLEKAIQVAIDSTNTEVFSLLLPRKITPKFLYEGNDKTKLSLDKQMVCLSRDGVGDLKLSMQLPVKDFPPIPHPANLQWHTIDGKWFCRMLAIVASACAKETSHPVLHGVVWQDGEIAGCDGIRLFILHDSRLAFGLGDKQIIVSLDTVNVLVRLFRTESAVEVAFESLPQPSVPPLDHPFERVHIRSGGVTLISQLIQGKYLNYQQIIPSSFPCKITFSGPVMLQRLNMIDSAAISTEVIKLIIRQCQSGEYECALSGGLGDDYQYALKCPVKLDTTDVGKIALALNYLLDSIKSFAVCSMEIISPSSPVRFTGDIDGMTVILMPMFVQW